VSAQPVAAPGAREVAFAATSGVTAGGLHGTETVYLLSPGARSARPVHRERVAIAISMRSATLAWHGRWLLYSASEGNTALVDSTSPGHAIELTRAVRSLPGVTGGEGDEGNLDLGASWSGGASTR